MEFLSKSVEETARIAQKFAPGLKPQEKAMVVGLYGELGSGKTTFMKYLAKSFGVKEIIQSPTFVIEKIYELFNQPFQYLIHVDAYRIEKPEEMINLGWNKIVTNPKNLICIEWPERIAEILPKHIIIKFEHSEWKGETSRKITIKQ
jgi:tRNA threonylcarbamoyladenosine biosynthesis protein TsaE